MEVTSSRVDAGAGRFAPSPSGDLHLGNLRTALLAWLFARASGRKFLLRIEDLDIARSGSAQRQIADLAAIGLDWDGPVVSQSSRLPLYEAAFDRLVAGGLVYECFCTKRELQNAATAPHGPVPRHPLACRNLTDAQRRADRPDRSPAFRLRADPTPLTVHDEVGGDYSGSPADVVIRRADGVFAYNLAVVVDDAVQGIDQVVRGDDLLPTTPTQAYLAHLLGIPQVRYAHVPMVLGPTGARLAKRDGAVTLAGLAATGHSPAQVLGAMAVSLDLASEAEPVTPTILLDRFDPEALPRGPWIVGPVAV